MHPRDVAARMAPSARSLPLSLSRSMEKGRPRFPRRFESCRFHVWRPFFHQDSPPTIRGLRDPAARSERDGDKCNGGGDRGEMRYRTENRARYARTRTHTHTLGIPLYHRNQPRIAEIHPLPPRLPPPPPSHPQRVCHPNHSPTRPPDGGVRG